MNHSEPTPIRSGGSETGNTRAADIMDRVLGAVAEIGMYEIVEEIQHSGMARLHKARDTNLNRNVAIKTIALEDSQKMIDLFDKEMKLLAQLDHPGVITIYHSGWDRKLGPCIVMPFIEGENLSTYLKRRKVFDFDLICKVIKELGEALDYVHEADVLHRDIKPSNIMLELQSGGLPKVKLIDFGIAAFADSIHVKTGNYYLMTPAYASPEQIRHISLTRASDIYSLGKVLFELLFGKGPSTAPFEHDHGGIQSTFEKAFDLEPEKRHASSRDLCDEVLEILEDYRAISEEMIPLQKKSNLFGFFASTLPEEPSEVQLPKEQNARAGQDLEETHNKHALPKQIRDGRKWSVTATLFALCIAVFFLGFLTSSAIQKWGVLQNAGSEEQGTASNPQHFDLGSEIEVSRQNFLIVSGTVPQDCNGFNWIYFENDHYTWPILALEETGAFEHSVIIPEDFSSGDLILACIGPKTNDMFDSIDIGESIREPGEASVMLRTSIKVNEKEEGGNDEE